MSNQNVSLVWLYLIWSNKGIFRDQWKKVRLNGSSITWTTFLSTFFHFNFGVFWPFTFRFDWHSIRSLLILTYVVSDKEEKREKEQEKWKFHFNHNELSISLLSMGIWQKAKWISNTNYRCLTHKRRMVPSLSWWNYLLWTTIKTVWIGSSRLK